MIDAELRVVVHHDIIRAAEERHAHNGARLAKAVADASDASDRHQKAIRASEMAVAGESDESPLQAEHAIHDAQMAVNASQKVHENMKVQHAKSAAGIRIASGLAYIPVMFVGAKRRIAACQKAEERGGRL